MAGERSNPSPGRPISAVPYLPGLDGVRALAVIAVIIYHANSSWLRGGFLGVEVFFVISGYLITLLLLAEHERAGRISLRAFYGRRARRLLPAAYLLLALVATLYSVVPYLRPLLARQRGGLVAGALYYSNWQQICPGWLRHPLPGVGWTLCHPQSYFDATERPPLLRHLWSLAVEEQFYIVWPILVILLIKAIGGRAKPQLGWIFLFATVNCWLLTAVFYNASDPNRAYLGTDTRAAGLLLGATMAMIWRPYALERGPLRDRGRLLSLVGGCGLVVLVIACIRFRDVVYTTDGVRGYSPLYYGGFAVVGLATLAVTASATHMHSWFGQRFLGFKPLVWLGTRSYGLYLYHWPIFQLTRPGAIDEGGDIDWPVWLIMIIRLALTFALTEFSYRLIEQPIRQRRVGRFVRSFLTDKSRKATFRRRRVGVGAALGAVLAIFVGVSVATARYQATDIEASLAEGEQAAGGIEDLLPATTPTTAAPAPTDAPSTSPGETIPATVPVTEPPPTTLPAFPMLAIGDSVMLGAAPIMRDSGIWVDAVVSRQVSKGIEALEMYQSLNAIGDIVIIHLGTNGPAEQAQFDRIMEILKDTKLVIFLTVKVPKPWQDANNQIIWNMQNYPNVRLIDWNGLSQAEEGVFYGDATHLRDKGQLIYTSYILDTIKNNT